VIKRAFDVCDLVLERAQIDNHPRRRIGFPGDGDFRSE